MDFNKVEEKWQKIWEEKQVFKCTDFDKKPKFMGLIEFPYPSGVGLHMGHIKAYTSMEVVARMKRLQGYNVMFPIGWDAFGLPTENFAIKNNIAPRIATDNNIRNMKAQFHRVGYSFDWSREVDTTDDKFYHWTQWIFSKMFEKGLAYRSKAFVNYCPKCDVILSNEESQGGECDRCGSQVVQKEKDVWFLKIRDYAERLLTGLDKVDYPARVKEEQRHWIGKSTGAEVDFIVKIDNKECDKLRIYTTRCDTLFGVTFMVIAPEHPLIEKYKDKISNMKDVEAYQIKAKQKSEFDRVQVNKDKSGVKLEGITAVNPLNKKEVPIFIADYVMMGYGTGAIMAVPAHDQRDYDFAKMYNLPIIPVIEGDISKQAYTDIAEGKLINSDFLNGLSVKEAKAKMIEHLTKTKIGCAKINYQMKDWAFNRQRYWGEPFPIVYCDKCGIVLVPEKDLPVKLPEIENFKPSKNGESPLAQVESWVNCTCPKCGGKARRETDTMPQWAGSSWYYLRYMDPHNATEFANKKNLEYWGPVDWYNGGMEHVTRHMIYSRFWNMFLYDLGLVPFEEPYMKRTTQGLVLGEDGNKMSKSLGNVVDPMDIIKKYGADVLRLYTLFMADYECSTPWSSVNITGCRRFLDRVERMQDFVDDFDGVHPEHIPQINVVIDKVTNDIVTFKFNTAISTLMTFVNNIYQDKFISREEFRIFLTMLYPFAPHIAEEMNEILGFKQCICESSWSEKLKDNSVKVINLPVQINGKMRGTIEVEENTEQDKIIELVKNNEKLSTYITGEIRKVIFVQNKIINIIV